MLQELSIWEDELGETASHPHRTSDAPPIVGAMPDVSTTFIHTHYIVERWREALLWSFVVGRIGGLNDEWGDDEISRAWEELGSRGDVRMGTRNTVTKLNRRKLVTNIAFCE